MEGQKHHKRCHVISVCKSQKVFHRVERQWPCCNLHSFQGGFSSRGMDHEMDGGSRYNISWLSLGQTEVSRVAHVHLTQTAALWVITKALKRLSTAVAFHKGAPDILVYTWCWLHGGSTGATDHGAHGLKHGQVFGHHIQKVRLQ